MRNNLRLVSSENQWVLDQDFYSLGRSRTATLKINRSQASRIHTFFFNDPERGLLVCDAGSQNGTFLNGQLILKPEVLVNSDVIDVASEPLHVSLEPSGQGGEAQKAVLESSVLLNVRFNDRGVDWGQDSKIQSRAVGEWFYRAIKLMMSHEGKVVRVTDRTVTGIWNSVDEQHTQRLQASVECARQIIHYGKYLNEQLMAECGMSADSYLFKVNASINLTPVKLQQLSNGQLKVLGDDLQQMEDISAKACELDCELVSTERFPTRAEDRSVSSPMLMVELGPRKQPMVLYPLRTD